MEQHLTVILYKKLLLMFLKPTTSRKDQTLWLVLWPDAILLLGLQRRRWNSSTWMWCDALLPGRLFLPESDRWCKWWITVEERLLNKCVLHPPSLTFWREFHACYLLVPPLTIWSWNSLFTIIWPPTTCTVRGWCGEAVALYVREGFLGLKPLSPVVLDMLLILVRKNQMD